MSRAMSHTEWVTLSNRVLPLDDVQLHAIVLQFLHATDAKTATSAIEKGLEMAEQTRTTTPADGGDPVAPATRRPSTGLGLGATVDEDIEDECPGCVGRGTGIRCCACGRPIPANLRRSREDSPSEIRDDCPDCLAGKTHTHGGAL